jgi:hypothetical protein
MSENIKPQHYEYDKVYSLSDFMDVKQIHFDIIADRLSRAGYVKRYNLKLDYDNKTLETDPNMTNEDINRHSFQYIINQITGIKIGRLVCVDDAEAIEYIQSDAVADKRHIRTDFKISDIDKNGEFVMTDYLYQTCVFSLMKGGVLRFTFREIPKIEESEK